MTEAIDQTLRNKDLELFLTKEDFDIENKKKKSKSKRKEVDAIIQRLENQIQKLQDDGASNFQDDSSLAPSNLYKRGIVSQAPSHRPHKRHTHHEQMSALDDVDQDLLIDDEEGLKKRRVKEK